MLIHAERTAARNLPKPTTVPTRAGVNYEKSFLKALRERVGPNFTIEHNTPFLYRHHDSVNQFCIPDILMFDQREGFIVVIEVKQTFVEGALEKLKTLYCPVVRKAYELPTTPLVVCRYLTPGSPIPSGRLSFAMSARYPLYQWIGSGAPIIF